MKNLHTCRICIQVYKLMVNLDILPTNDYYSNCGANIKSRAARVYLNLFIITNYLRTS